MTADPGTGLADLEDRLVALVASGEVKVPPYPAVAFKLESLVRGGDYGIDDIALLVVSDQVLSADVLRCANSAAYARGNPAASVLQAVTRIGAKDIGRIALASGLGSHALAEGPLAPLRRRAWLDALASALLCQALAAGRKLPPDVAFSAGLLHDFGAVVAIACIEELVARRKDVTPRPAGDWEAVVDRFHVELGIVTAARWGLPAVLADAISLHHAADASGAESPALVALVAETDRVVGRLRERTHLSEEDLAAAGLLAPSERALAARVVETLPEFVASFEEEPAAGAEAVPVLVEPPPAPPDAGPRPPPYAVVLTAGKAVHACELVGIGSTHCMARGKTAVPENFLLGLTVKCEPPIVGHASVKLSWPEGDGFMLLVQPYALPKDAISRWRALVEESTKERGEAAPPG